MLATYDKPRWRDNLSSLELIRWAIDTYPKLIMTSGFNLNGIVLLDLAVKAAYRGKVVFIDTGYHFKETLETRDHLRERYPELDFVTLNAQLPDDQLFASDSHACCKARKVNPLEQYLQEVKPDALLNARTREQGGQRSQLGFVELGKETQINPLVFWSRAQLESYALEHDLPLNPLYREGFLSIGCAPCTRAVRPGEAVRAGRWAGSGKTECGLWERA